MTDTSGRAVLFDIDGTLCDTNYLHVLAWRRVFLEQGEPEITAARIHRLVGMGTDQLLETLCGRPRPELKPERARHFDALKGEVRAVPRAGDLLRAVRARGARVVLATSAEKSDLEALLAAIDADDAIDAVTHADEVEEAKPAPDVFASALERAGTPPEATVVVGDTVWDVEAAARAGLPCVAVLSGGISRAELEAAGAVAVYDDVGALLDGLDASPLLGTSTASSSRRTE
ncbi:MAG TPA: HAD family hydrolase [Acidimicrobiia bacterium]|nr:HAD family hydrolase [Acidimicrobiia bacterium]